MRACVCICCYTDCFNLVNDARFFDVLLSPKVQWLACIVNTFSMIVLFGSIGLFIVSRLLMHRPNTHKLSILALYCTGRHSNMWNKAWTSALKILSSRWALYEVLRLILVSGFDFSKSIASMEAGVVAMLFHIITWSMLYNTGGNYYWEVMLEAIHCHCRGKRKNMQNCGLDMEQEETDLACFVQKVCRLINDICKVSLVKTSLSSTKIWMFHNNKHDFFFYFVWLVCHTQHSAVPRAVAK